MRKTITVIILAALLAAVNAACAHVPEDSPEVEKTPEGPVATESNAQMFEDTKDCEAAIWYAGTTDITALGDDLLVTASLPKFKFDCHGLDENKTLYVFIDGMVDDPAGVFEDVTYIYSGVIDLDGFDATEGEHVVQFVQFDGHTPTFCQTCHYTFKIE